MYHWFLAKAVMWGMAAAPVSRRGRIVGEHARWPQRPFRPAEAGCRSGSRGRPVRARRRASGAEVEEGTRPGRRRVPDARFRRAVGARARSARAPPPERAGENTHACPQAWFDEVIRQFG
ncbi:hypothetical protein GCM10010515_09730 [Streptomyces fructofermentans]|uniref:Uncharacterized protein n=1 Tax=Streptomyces fructofermentans TaxID=152141 RepID=A0A918N7P5_9ACTN|nr:hypothetical protein GCM10010515_09730 [Streptomyces fructofermentans]